jgi:hypothetical protein
MACNLIAFIKRYQSMRYQTLILSLLLLTLTSPAVRAQTTSASQSLAGQQEIGVGIGFSSVYKELANAFGDNTNNYNLSPVWSMTYRYYTRRMSVGVALSYENLVNNDREIGYTTYSHSHDAMTIVGIVPEFTFNYINKVVNEQKAELRLYGLVAAGATILSESDDYYNYGTRLLPTLQLTPVGIRYGRDFTCSCELGIGYKGLINFGVSYRMFPQHTASIPAAKED